MLSYDFSELTRGSIRSLGELSEAKIEKFLGLTITPGNPAPLFDAMGNPLVSDFGKPVIVSYTHASLLVTEIMNRAKRSNAQMGADVQDLPLPFWRPTDVLVYSADHHVIAAVRSNVTRNAPVRCLFTAAGFPQAKDGRPENIMECAERELHEEAGLSIKQLAPVNEPLFLDPCYDHPLQYFPVETSQGKKTGCVTAVTTAVAVQSGLSASEIMEKISPNEESVGFIAFPVSELYNLQVNAITKWTVPFKPSTTICSMFIKQLGKRDISLLSVVAKQKELDVARFRAQAAEATKPAAGRYQLGIYPSKATLSRDDFTFNGTSEYIDRLVMGAEKLKLMPTVPFVQKNSQQPVYAT